MAHQMDSLCSPDISLSTAHVHGPSMWAGLSPVFAAGPATGSTTLSLLLCEFKPYNTPFPSRLIFARTITQSPYFLSPTALCFSASAFCSIRSSSISVRLTNSETLSVQMFLFIPSDLFIHHFHSPDQPSHCGLLVPCSIRLYCPLGIGIISISTKITFPIPKFTCLSDFWIFRMYLACTCVIKIWDFLNLDLSKSAYSFRVVCVLQGCAGAFGLLFLSELLHVLNLVLLD